MKRICGALFIGLGVLMLSVACLNAQDAPDFSYLVGTFLPGLLFTILGLALRREDPHQTAVLANSQTRDATTPEDEGRSARFQSRATLGVAAGILAMFLGSGISKSGPDHLWTGAATALGGWALLIWGCVNYARWKGLSGWLGFCGYLLLPGLLILVLFPNRRNRLLHEHFPEEPAGRDALSVRDRIPGYRYLLTLAPVGVLALGLGGVAHLINSNIDAAEWKDVTHPELGFRARMPGMPRREQTTHETPTGNVVLQKFTVEPRGQRELFMIVAIQFPNDAARALGGTEQLLELGRQDVVSATQGEVTSEQRIAVGGRSGVQLEVSPSRGGFGRARIYATDNHLYEVIAQVPRIRSSSEDVQMFFESFVLTDEATR
jgi:hypothetical protein